MAMYNASLAGGGSSVTIDDVVYEGDLKLKSVLSDIRLTNLPYNFYAGSAVVLDGEIHILGGADSNHLDSHYKWDGTSWTSVMSIPYHFKNGSAVVLDGEIHILGGDYKSSSSPGNYYYRSHYKYNSITNKWNKEKFLPYYFYYGSAVVLESLYILGGNYDTSLGYDNYQDETYRSMYKIDAPTYDIVS